MTLICALLAASPDLDLLVPGGHRRMTHSLFAVGVVLLATAAATRLRSARVDWRITAACTLAYATHLLTDYFGVDRGTPAGIPLLWPWSGTYFISTWSLFRETERYDLLGMRALITNIAAVAQEVLLLGPILVFVWLRCRRLAGNVASGAPSSTPPSGLRSGGGTDPRFADTPDGQ